MATVQAVYMLLLVFIVGSHEEFLNEKLSKTSNIYISQETNIYSGKEKILTGVKKTTVRVFTDGNEEPSDEDILALAEEINANTVSALNPSKKLDSYSYRETVGALPNDFTLNKTVIIKTGPSHPKVMFINLKTEFHTK